MTRVALVTCLHIPEVDHDEDLLVQALTSRGIDAVVAAWDDPAFAWDACDAAVLRSTWNYYEDIASFLAWASSTAQTTLLLNPLEVVRANCHKSYLGQLAASGVPIVPTEFLPAGEAWNLAHRARTRGWERVVFKPAVSAGSHNTYASSTADLDSLESQLQTHLADVDMMLQPFIDSVSGYGERSLVFVDEVFQHAIRKSPRFATDAESVSRSSEPVTESERALAESVLHASRSLWSDAAQSHDPLLYARVDLVPDTHGAPLLMELELIEPSLFLAQHAPTLDALADAIAARVRARS